MNSTHITYTPRACTHVFRHIVWPGFRNPLDAQCIKCGEMVQQ